MRPFNTDREGRITFLVDRALGQFWVTNEQNSVLITILHYFAGIKTPTFYTCQKCLFLFFLRPFTCHSGQNRKAPVNNASEMLAKIKPPLSEWRDYIASARNNETKILFPAAGDQVFPYFCLEYTSNKVCYSHPFGSFFPFCGQKGSLSTQTSLVT